MLENLTIPWTFCRPDNLTTIDTNYFLIFYVVIFPILDIEYSPSNICFFLHQLLVIELNYRRISKLNICQSLFTSWIYSYIRCIIYNFYVYWFQSACLYSLHFYSMSCVFYYILYRLHYLIFKRFRFAM